MAATAEANAQSGPRDITEVRNTLERHYLISLNCAQSFAEALPQFCHTEKLQFAYQSIGWATLQEVAGVATQVALDRLSPVAEAVHMLLCACLHIDNRSFGTLGWMFRRQTSQIGSPALGKLKYAFLGGGLERKWWICFQGLVTSEHRGEMLAGGSLFVPNVTKDSKVWARGHWPSSPRHPGPSSPSMFPGSYFQICPREEGKVSKPKVGLSAWRSFGRQNEPLIKPKC
ncbi:hypothetical protein FA13DRAFT_1707055 [Coprinellus micaceus]|uniref:Uncharacterized protein n=1 Tax=Coprinellus micaceus TaxID=71717 RepID=A0A4Y7TKY7_COPMI|nr:hypothetical protein FA13DRAFT_1707055 [Coprinellus micaceus]